MKNKNRPKNPKMVFYWVLLLISLIFAIQFATMGIEDPIEISYNEFLAMVEEDKVSSVIINLRNSTFSFEDEDEVEREYVDINTSAQTEAAEEAQVTEE